MSKPPSPAPSSEIATAKNVCGIVMPIAAMGDDYSEEHWRRVRRILQRAIERAGLKPQLVWENPEVDVIQSAILQNIYENDVVICDLSGLNSNVILETGLRLSTKKPTIIITDKINRPPFDVSIIGYIDYQKDLEYNATEEFIERLSKKIIDADKSYMNNSYKSFVENFTFETVTPARIEVSSEDFMKEQMQDILTSVRRLEANQRAHPQAISPNRRHETASTVDRSVLRMVATLSASSARALEAQIDAHEMFDHCAVRRISDEQFHFTVPLSRLGTTKRSLAEEILRELIKSSEENDIPF